MPNKLSQTFKSFFSSCVIVTLKLPIHSLSFVIFSFCKYTKINRNTGSTWRYLLVLAKQHIVAMLLQIAINKFFYVYINPPFYRQLCEPCHNLEIVPKENGIAVR